MKRVFDTISGVALAFFVTLVLNAGINYFTQPKGEVRISPTVAIQGQFYVPVNITNFSSAPINGLIMSVPKSVNVSNMVASNPTQINPVPDTLGIDAQKRVEISGLEPQRIVTLLVPLTQQAEANLLQPVNHKQLGLGYQKPTDIENPLVNSLVNTIGTTLLFSFIIGVLYYVVEGISERQLQALSRLLDQRGQEVEKLAAQLERQEKQAENARKAIARVNFLLSTRLSDYRKELAFWRDTIRKVLYETSHDQKISETIIAQVTETLKTYRVLSRPVDSEETNWALEMMSSPPEEQKETKKLQT